jgi:hypothetical protein
LAVAARPPNDAFNPDLLIHIDCIVT